jgi:hypothetical protein
MAVCVYVRTGTESQDVLRTYELTVRVLSVRIVGVR